MFRMIGIKELNSILIIEGGLCVIKRYAMFFAVRYTFLMIPRELQFIHKYTVCINLKIVIESICPKGLGQSHETAAYIQPNTQKPVVSEVFIGNPCL